MGDQGEADAALAISGGKASYKICKKLWPLALKLFPRTMSPLLRAHNIADIREQARRRLPKGIFEFIDRGAEDEVALRNNRAAFERVHLCPRVLSDVSGRSTSTELLGHEVNLPAAIAPTGAAGLVWYQGELELAKAAASKGIPFTLATRSMSSIEDIARLAGGILWFQLYVWADRSLSWALVDRAREADFQALLVTVDVPVAPNREYNTRNGFSLPFKPGARSLLDLARHPRWLATVMGRYLATTGMPRYENVPGESRQKITAGGGRTTQSMRSDTLVWRDIRELRDRWPRTLMVKGILHAEDAVRAVECGADAVVVSNHGGRCLDSAPAPMDVLPEIVAAVNGRAAVLIDSGVRRGGDIVKALACGASATLVGRPTLFGTAIGGQTGAARVIAILQQEMLTVMGQIGCTDVRDIGPGFLRAVEPRVPSIAMAAA